VNVLDLFSGIGGFSLGLERAGMKTVAFCEIEPYCRAVLRKHWPDVPIYDDVRTLTAARLAADGILSVADTDDQGELQQGRIIGQERRWSCYSGIDAICGGFPCQDISVAGKGAGIEGERSGLWSEYARIIGEVRPRYVIVENVAALLGRGLSRVLGDLAALGYNAEWHCIPASAVSAPHRRDRLWIMAYASGSERRQDDSSCGRVQWADSLSQRQESSGRIGANGADVRHPHRAGSQVTQADQDRQTILSPAAIERADWWLVEPDVGRLAARLSNGLDGGLSAHEGCIAKARSKGIPQTNRLRFLRQYIESTAASSGPPRCAFCAHPMSSLPCEGGCSPWAMGPWRQEDQDLRCVREGLPELFAQSGQDLQQVMPIGDWQAEREQAVGNRVARLKALGNAVVPQIPEIIGKAIMRSVFL
jgi:DNA (cytosine-5)-methyltransferase 1